MPFQSKELFRIVSIKSPFGKNRSTVFVPESAQNGIMPDGFFLESHFFEFWIAFEQIFHDNGHFHHKFPIFIFLFATFFVFRDDYSLARQTFQKLKLDKILSYFRGQLDV